MEKSAAPPLVSVVIPTYNRAHVICEAVESAFAQSYPRLEVIVIDDGSTDATPQVLAPYGDRIVYVRQPNGGISSARNTGLRVARGEYLAWLDSDDVWTREKCAVQVAFLEAHPKIVLISSDFSAFGAGRNEESHIAAYFSLIRKTPGGLASLYPETYRLEAGSIPWLAADVGPITVRCGWVYEGLVFGNFIGPPTVMMRRSELLKTGGLEESLPNAMEYEYFLRICRLGKAAYVDRPLTRYRYSLDQISSEKHMVDLWLSTLRIVEGVERSDPEFVRSHRRAFAKRLAACHAETALALAETAPGAAVRHLLASLRCGPVDRRCLRTIARLTLPSWLRRLRRSVLAPN